MDIFNSRRFLDLFKNIWFIIPVLCWTLFVCSIFDIYDLSGVGSALVCRWLAVIILTYLLLLMASVSIEPGTLWILINVNIMSISHLNTWVDPISETLCVLNMFQIMGTVQRNTGLICRSRWRIYVSVLTKYEDTVTISIHYINCAHAQVLNCRVSRFIDIYDDKLLKRYRNESTVIYLSYHILIECIICDIR
jgi:hypothetical protein